MARRTTAGPKTPRKPKIDPILARIQAKAAELEAAESVIITHSEPPEPISTKEDNNLVRLESVYARLGVTAEEVENYPKITENFKEIGGIPGVMEYMRGSDDRVAREIVRLYDLSGRDQTKSVVPFEAYCAAAKVTKKKFMQILMGEVCDQSDAVSTLMAASAHPEIVKKTIEVAKSDQFGANESRAILHKHRGFLPSPKNQQVTIHGNVNQDNRQDNSKNVMIPITTLNLGNEKISRGVDRFNEARIVQSESTDLETDELQEVEE